MTKTRLILASSSPYRKHLLQKLRLKFTTVAADIDETPLQQETASSLVKRLAKNKAQTVAVKNLPALVIGSDQCAELDGHILGKPGNHEHARQQLQAAAGKDMIFHTGLCLLDNASGRCWLEDVPFPLRLRELTPAQIEYYLQQEKPYQCAGSFKAEGLGIALFESLCGDDFSALIGLPLIRLCSFLQAAGITVLGDQH